MLSKAKRIRMCKNLGNQLTEFEKTELSKYHNFWKSTVLEEGRFRVADLLKHASKIVSKLTKSFKHTELIEDYIEHRNARHEERLPKFMRKRNSGTPKIGKFSFMRLKKHSFRCSKSSSRFSHVNL